MLSGLIEARLSALALDGVPGLLGAGELGETVSRGGRGLRVGVCCSCGGLENRVGEFGLASALGEDQAVIKLRTVVGRKRQAAGRKGRKEWEGARDIPLGLGIFAVLGSQASHKQRASTMGLVRLSWLRDRTFSACFQGCRADSGGKTVGCSWKRCVEGRSRRVS